MDMTIDDLVAAPYNPRRISEDAASGLRESVSRYGDIAGITWNKRTGRLVTGHQRVNQLRALGAEMVDGALQLPSGHRFAVRIVDWGENEERAANVTANNPHIGGEFTADLDSLLAELGASMSTDDFDSVRLDALVTFVPEFKPESEDGVPDLTDEKKVVCPECGHEFAPRLGKQ